MSFWTSAIVAAKKAVIIPITRTKFKATVEYSKIGEHLAAKNTPAVTIVAAWIRADTGVGPSIASGSQVCNKNCADFPIAPINSSMLITVIELNWKPISDISLFWKLGIFKNTSL